jgi:hypothetical protein
MSAAAGYFWTSWFITLAPLLIGSLIFTGLHIKNAPRFSIKDLGFPRVQYIPLILFAAFISFALFSSLSFDFMDNKMLIKHWLVGVPKPPPIWEGGGRFFPLQTSEFYFIYKWASSIYVYFSVSLIQFCIFMFSIQHLLNVLGQKSVFNSLAIVCLGSTLMCFTGIVYPERSVLFYLPFFYLSVFKWHTQKKWLWFFLAGLTAHMMLYYKEPVFTLIGAVSFTGILSFLLLKKKTKQDIPYLEIMLLALCMIWVGLYIHLVPVFDIFFSDNLKGDPYASPGTENLSHSLFVFLYHEPMTILYMLLGVMIVAVKISSVRETLSTPKGKLMIALILGSLGYFAILCVLFLKLRWYTSVPVTAMLLGLLCYGNGSASFIKSRNYFACAFLILNVFFTIPIFSAYLDHMKKTKLTVDTIRKENITDVHLHIVDHPYIKTKKTADALFFQLHDVTFTEKESESSAQIIVHHLFSSEVKRDNESLMLYDKNTLELAKKFIPSPLHIYIEKRYTIFCTKCWIPNSKKKNREK